MGSPTPKPLESDFITYDSDDHTRPTGDSPELAFIKTDESISTSTTVKVYIKQGPAGTTLTGPPDRLVLSDSKQLWGIRKVNGAPGHWAKIRIKTRWAGPAGTVMTRTEEVRPDEYSEYVEAPSTGAWDGEVVLQANGSIWGYGPLGHGTGTQEASVSEDTAVTGWKEVGFLGPLTLHGRRH